MRLILSFQRRPILCYLFACVPLTGLFAICGWRISKAGKSSSFIYSIKDIYLWQSNRVRALKSLWWIGEAGHVLPIWPMLVKKEWQVCLNFNFDRWFLVQYYIVGCFTNNPFLFMGYGRSVQLLVVMGESFDSNCIEWLWLWLILSGAVVSNFLLRMCLSVSFHCWSTVKMF